MKPRQILVSLIFRSPEGGNTLLKQPNLMAISHNRKEAILCEKRTKVNLR
jgi:hypothetical protein